VFERVTAAGIPVDLIPEELVSIVVALGGDAENSLRSATLEFMDTVRKVEHAVAASRRPDDVPEVLDIAQLGVITEEEWRAHWPMVVPEADEVETDVETVEDEPAADVAVEDEPVEEPEALDEPVEENDETEEPDEPSEPDETSDQEKSVEPQ
jgi:XTP/dITP diphosphohydrolase